MEQSIHLSVTHDRQHVQSKQNLSLHDAVTTCLPATRFVLSEHVLLLEQISTIR